MHQGHSVAASVFGVVFWSFFRREAPIFLEFWVFFLFFSQNWFRTSKLNLIPEIALRVKKTSGKKTQQFLRLSAPRVPQPFRPVFFFGVKTPKKNYLELFFGVFFGAKRRFFLEFWVFFWSFIRREAPEFFFGVIFWRKNRREAPKIIFWSFLFNK